MSNNKKSSLELFALTLYEKGLLVGDGDLIQTILDLHKGMHKKEIVEAYYIDNEKNEGFEYYEAKFGGNNE